MSDRCDLSSDCTFGAHDASDHPCGRRHTPGSDCDYCGRPTPPNGEPCPDCWTPIPANLADAKALLALGDLSLDPRSSDE
jgi:hypothetical protein